MKSRKSLPQALGSVLRAFRLQAGMSQEELADTAELHRTYIGSIERGERNITLKNVDRILTSLNKSWIDFGKAFEGELYRK
jgi:transcriptional regulator with XRE-family HTH domain